MMISSIHLPGVAASVGVAGVAPYQDTRGARRVIRLEIVEI